MIWNVFGVHPDEPFSAEARTSERGFSLFAFKGRDAAFFYVPGKDPEKTVYDPYQKRFKPEDMLNLLARVLKIKADILRHDPRVVSMIQDLKPKNNDPQKEL